MTANVPEWFLAVGEERIGPMSEAELRQLIALEGAGDGAWVWHRGMRDWEPLQPHFPAVPGRYGDAREADSPVASRRSRFPLFWLFLALCASGLAAWVASDVWGRIGTRSIVVSVAGVALVAGSLWGAFTFKLWRHAQSLSRADRSGARGGGWKALACCTGMVVVASLALVFSYFPLLHRIALAREAYDSTEVAYDPASSTIRVDGTIGPSFSSKIADILEVHAGVLNLEISSAGGLVDQALDVAEMVESARLTTIAREECNSACILVLMAGSERYADWNLSLGFHAASPITELPSLNSEDEALVYLRRRGVPHEILAVSAGSTELTMVPGSRLVRDGALSGLLDGPTPVSPDTADLRFLEELLSDESPLVPLGALLRALRELKPGFATEAFRLIQLIEDMNLSQSGATSGIAEEAGRVLGEIVARNIALAVECADPEVLHSYLASTYRQLRYLEEMEQWKACVGYLGEGVENLASLSETRLDEEWKQLESLFRSAALHDWRPAPVPRWAEAEAAKLVESTLKEFPELLRRPELLDSDPETNCRWSSVFLKGLQELPPERAAGVFRHFSSSGGLATSPSPAGEAEPKARLSLPTKEKVNGAVPTGPLRPAMPKPSPLSPQT